jgi:hypothetical protein
LGYFDFYALQVGDEDLYIPGTAIVLSEGMKLIASFLLVLYEHKSLSSAVKVCRKYFFCYISLLSLSFLLEIAGYMASARVFVLPALFDLSLSLFKGRSLNKEKKKKAKCSIFFILLPLTAPCFS